MEGKLEIHETTEKIEEAHHRDNKRAAILIIALAAALAIIEMAGKEAQFAALAENINASDTYAFYQAKTIRSTMLQMAVENAALLPADPSAAADQGAARQKQIEVWKATTARLDSDPEKREGRKELLERAKEISTVRDREIHAYHDYEYAAAALQLAIVMASAAVITEFTLLEIISAALGLVGIAMGLVGWLAPALFEL
jgi:hypothetical protein